MPIIGKGTSTDLEQLFYMCIPEAPAVGQVEHCLCRQPLLCSSHVHDTVVFTGLYSANTGAPFSEAQEVLFLTPSPHFSQHFIVSPLDVGEHKQAEVRWLCTPGISCVATIGSAIQPCSVSCWVAQGRMHAIRNSGSGACSGLKCYSRV